MTDFTDGNKIMILSQIFKVKVKNKSIEAAEVILTQSSLIIRSSNSARNQQNWNCGVWSSNASKNFQCEIFSKDITCVKPGIPNYNDKPGSTCIFTIIAYPKNIKIQYFFYLKTPSDPNIKIRNRFMIEEQVRKEWVGSLLANFFKPNQLSQILINPNRNKRLLVIMNPNSNKGQSKNVFNKLVEPILNESGIEREIFLTNQKGHLRDWIFAENLLKWSRGVVICGGDGTIHELINGLFMRGDWQTALKSITICPIPVGSGNGLARSIYHLQNKDQGIRMTKNICTKSFILSSIVDAARGSIRKLDLFYVQNAKRSFIAFLSAGWGLIPDVDIERESLKGFGHLRYVIYSLLRIARRRKYKAKLSYLPINFTGGGESTVSSKSSKSSSTYSKSKNYIMDSNTCSTCSLTDHEREDHNLLKYAANNWTPPPRILTIQNKVSGYNDQPMSFQTYSYSSLLNEGQLYFRSWHELGDHLGSGTFPSNNQKSSSRRYPSISGSSLSTSSSSKKNFVKGRHSITNRPKPKFIHLPETTNDSVSSNWITLEKDFVCIYVVNLPYITSSDLVAPESRTDDGILWLLILHGDVARSNLLKFMATLERGYFDHIPGIELIPIKAFRIEPLDKAGRFTVDGEVIEFETLQGHVMPSATYCLSKI